MHGQHHGQHLLLSELTLDGSVNQVNSPSESFLLLLLPLPPLLQHSPVRLCVEAATSLFNGMSRKRSIVPACLKYRASLNNLLPPFKKLQHSCDSEGCSQFTFSNSDKLPVVAVQCCNIVHSSLKECLWKDFVLLDLKLLHLVNTA